MNEYKNVENPLILIKRKATSEKLYRDGRLFVFHRHSIVRYITRSSRSERKQMSCHYYYYIIVGKVDWACLPNKALQANNGSRKPFSLLNTAKALMSRWITSFPMCDVWSQKSF